MNLYIAETGLIASATTDLLSYVPGGSSGAFSGAPAGSRRRQSAPSVNVAHGGALSGPFMNLYVAATGLIASATTDLL